MKFLAEEDLVPNARRHPAPRASACSSPEGALKVVVEVAAAPPPPLLANLRPGSILEVLVSSVTLQVQQCGGELFPMAGGQRATEWDDEQGEGLLLDPES